ncbi:hypothetical protein M413DRAFT_259160 [Hebeloma cylindrosporum]|uniref:Uncharacterized protein n=1 Tax=Hebeloma cylindrosporum TaxID=76867 RepID=A0A0C3C073_HEBCY|nr:hypothetical protein M413DRAFT_259160 [Hebeloma cylindrosporum h7]
MGDTRIYSVRVSAIQYKFRSNMYIIGPDQRCLKKHWNPPETGNMVMAKRHTEGYSRLAFCQLSMQQGMEVTNSTCIDVRVV